MRQADLDAPTRAIDLLRIALGIPTSAERQARITREVSSVSMRAYPHGVVATMPNGRRIFLSATALTGKE